MRTVTTRYVPPSQHFFKPCPFIIEFQLYCVVREQRKHEGDPLGLLMSPLQSGHGLFYEWLAPGQTLQDQGQRTLSATLPGWSARHGLCCTSLFLCFFETGSHHID